MALIYGPILFSGFFERHPVSLSLCCLPLAHAPLGPLFTTGFAIAGGAFGYQFYWAWQHAAARMQEQIEINRAKQDIERANARIAELKASQINLAGAAQVEVTAPMINLN